MTVHEQVPFITMNGKTCGVDAGMFDILMVLKRLGVVTQYSCEGNLGTGYICARGRGARKLERLFKRLRAKNQLSRQSEQIVDNFITGTRTLEVYHFRNHGRRVYRLLNRIRKSDGEYAVETEYSIFYGYRICYRWPVEDSNQLLAALVEIVDLA